MVGFTTPRVTLRGPYRSNLEHLHDEWARIELFIRAQVMRWRHSASCAAPESSWGMVVVSTEEVDSYLQSQINPPGARTGQGWEEVKPWWDEAASLRERIDQLCRNGSSLEDLRLLRLVRLFNLCSAETDILLLCLMAEVDDRYRRLFGYLQNDASRQSLHVELISQILPLSHMDHGAIRDLFSPSGRLQAHRLIVLGAQASAEDSLPLRSVRIDDRIGSYLLGSDDPDARLSGILRYDQTPADPPAYVRPDLLKVLQRLPEAVTIGLQNHECVRLLFFGADRRLAARAARAVCTVLACPLFEFDVRAALRATVPWEVSVDLAYREARLRDAALYIHGGEALLNVEAERVRWEYLEHTSAVFHTLTIADVDSVSCPPGAVNDAQFCCIDLPLPDYDTRQRIWLAHLPQPDELGMLAEERLKLAADLANAFQVTEAQIEDAVAGAANLSRRENPVGGQIRPSHVFESCRRQSGRRLVAFAQRIVPRPSLSIDNVVLPAPNKRQLLDLRNRIRHHRELFHRTGLEQSMRLGKGLLALFAGASGTGKTMAAEALANGQGVDLYKVDLSAVVSKWIGETEKNLSRIFSEAEHSNGWLFFDEGESLFGSRGDIKQAQDRFLNMEVNYLLQRIEEFSGVVILATNLRQNIDEAFLRRIHAVVEFPAPSAALRVEIWKGMIPTSMRRGFDEQQLSRFGTRFELSGGNISNAVLDGMFRSYAGEDEALTLRHLVVGVAREYQKLGRPITPAEFGETFYPWVVEDILDPRPDKGMTKDS